MIMAGAACFPLSRPRAADFTAHGVTVHSAGVLGIAHGEADLLPLHAGVADRRAVQRSREHLEVLLEAQRALPQAPAARDLRRRVIEMRGAPVAAVARRLLGH